MGKTPENPTRMGITQQRSPPDYFSHPTRHLHMSQRIYAIPPTPTPLTGSRAFENQKNTGWMQALMGLT